MAFLTEPEPERHAALPVLPGVSRIVAENPGPMTYHGTNTYLIETRHGRVVLDPGPDDPRHVEAIMTATGGKVDLILLSHTHHDHLGATAALREATGALTAGFRTPADPEFSPDIELDDGAAIAGLAVLHTPGHAADHMCLAMTAADGGTILFTADHVMSWNSSAISPPGGDMAAYFASLRRLLDRTDDLFLPGHGPPLPDPRRLTRALLAHRMERERAILAASRREPMSPAALRERMYGGLDPRLNRAAEQTILAHLVKLESEAKAAHTADLWRAV